MCARRTSVASLAAIVSLALASSQSPTREAAPKVIFVCEHGAAKSVIAAAYFNKLAIARGLPHRALSRGTQPDPTVSPKVAKTLQSEGFAIPPDKPQLIREREISGAERVVTLGCTLPTRAAVTKWDDVPSVSENYPAASHVIREHVQKLVEELAGKQSSPKGKDNR